MGCSSSKTTNGVVNNLGSRVATHSSNSSRDGDRHLGYNMLKVLKATEGGRFYDIYEIQPGKLGEAAMGCVVRGAIKKRTGERFAVKTFMVSSVPSKSAQRRILGTLRNEIDMLRSLDHPNIIRAYESYEVGKDLHLVMELCTGGDLNARTYTEAQAADVVRMVLSAILHSHQKGIIHRDLKFENILWESDAPDAQIKLIDFGMSARFQEGMPMSERVGSVYTMAPEVLEGNYTKQADLWSLGCITFHLIAGEPPFECDDEVETMKRLLAVRYFWPKGLKVSSEAKEFVYRLLKYDPRRRWTVEQAIASNCLRKYFPPPPKRNHHHQQQQQQQFTEGQSDPLPPSAESEPNSVAAAKAIPETTAEADPNHDSKEVKSNSMDATAAVEKSGCSNGTGVTELKDKEAILVKEEEKKQLQPVEKEPSLENRLLSSMRSYRSYGVFRRVALMVVAYHQTPSKLTDLRNEFVDFDTEKNGEISWEEMQRALEKRGVDQEEIKGLFKSLDVDGSGKIQYLEFLAATIEAVGAADEEERLRHAFERLDTDESGFITVANLKELVGPCCDDEALQKTIEDADLRKDGRVGWDEFLILMRGRQENGRKAVEDSSVDYASSSETVAAAK